MSGAAPDELVRLVARRWTLPVLDALKAGASRPSALERRLAGIPSQGLTAALTALVDAGLITRQQASHRMVEYRLTDLGRQVVQAADELRSLAG